MELQKELVYREYIQRENNILHAPYNSELEFYSVIQAGNVEKTKELCQDSLLTKEGLGKLSDDYLQHIKYHFVITTALVARYCIEGGMELSQAYSLSDFYIQMADKKKKPEEVVALHPKMCVDYAKRMRSLRKQKVCSKHIALALDYIYDNLHTRITLPVLADYVGLNESYLSRLFKKETGQSVVNFIQTKKLETAQNMLIYSDYSPAQIANTLAFPSQSYFTELFRKKTGVPPTKYRAMHLRSINVGKTSKEE